MFAKNLFQVVVCLVAVLLVGCHHGTDGRKPSSASLASRDGLFFLSVMHLNDAHSHLAPLEDQSLILGGLKTYVPMGGFARIRTRVEEIRSRGGHSLLLHAGDAVQGTLYFTRYHGDADMAALNLLGVDAMAVGNHEFDKGPELPARLADEADFPLLGANIDISGEPRLQGKIIPYVIKTLGDERVGIIGLITPETATMSSPGPTVRFDDVAATAGKVAGESLQSYIHS